MSTIVVKNMPDNLHALLKQRAEQNHRSMTKEVVHLIEAGLEAAPQRQPLPPPVALRDGRKMSTDAHEPAVADGRDALRAALIEQSDGSYVNVLGIEDEAYFATLERLRAEAEPRDVTRLFDNVE